MIDNKKRLDIRTLFMILYAVSLILFGFIVDSPNEIMAGLKNIIIKPNPLITDYMHSEIGGIGATLVNSGILTLIFVILLRSLKINFTGATFAALFTISGFAFFGKNLYNVWFVVLGVFLYSRIQREKFSKYIYIALFGTAMSPLATEITFNLNLPLIISMPLGAILGIFIGVILPPVSTHLLKMHLGYNLYNVGFTAGIIGTVVISIFNSFGYESKVGELWSEGQMTTIIFHGLKVEHNQLFSYFLYPMFLVFIVTGFILNGYSFKKLRRVMKYSGRLVCDFVVNEGFGITLVNMGILGIISTTYILLIKGDLNGPTMGGIFTIVGFAAFGKHPRNVVPIFMGVAFASMIKITMNIDDPALQLAALFGTALAPIAGEYGVFGILFGFLAAVIHSSVVQRVGYLHGGLNLYNNGFSAGIVATVLVPIIEAFRKDERD